MEKMLKQLLAILAATACINSSGELPSIRDYCQQLLADDTEERPCSRQQCHGRPGKIGPKGTKGNKGDLGTCEQLQGRVTTLEAQIRLVLENVPGTRIIFCSMGMKSREISDSAITTSSIADYRHAGHFGRLDETPSPPNNLAIWCAKYNTLGEWIQIDLLQPRSVSGIVTRGRPSADQHWVTSYKIGCGNSPDAITIVSEFGRKRVFGANVDESTKVTNIFPSKMTCRYVRLYPQTWHHHICLRMELLRGDCSF